MAEAAQPVSPVKLRLAGGTGSQRLEVADHVLGAPSLDECLRGLSVERSQRFLAQQARRALDIARHGCCHVEHAIPIRRRNVFHGPDSLATSPFQATHSQPGTGR